MGVPRATAIERGRRNPQEAGRPWLRPRVVLLQKPDHPLLLNRILRICAHRSGLTLTLKRVQSRGQVSSPLVIGGATLCLGSLHLDRGLQQRNAAGDAGQATPRAPLCRLNRNTKTCQTGRWRHDRSSGIHLNSAATLSNKPGPPHWISLEESGTRRLLPHLLFTRWRRRGVTPYSTLRYAPSSSSIVICRLPRRRSYPRSTRAAGWS